LGIRKYRLSFPKVIESNGQTFKKHSFWHWDKMAFCQIEIWQSGRKKILNLKCTFYYKWPLSKLS
jgi:hypothetical protein